MSTDHDDSPTSQNSFNFSNSESSPSRFGSKDWSSLLLLRSSDRLEYQKVKDSEIAAIERSNFVNICKLIIKELIEQSLRFGRMLDSDHVCLSHFFIIMEHVLKHRLKSKPKGFLGAKKELWDILRQVERYAPEAREITESVRNLPNVKSVAGRTRAWLKIALMQKKLMNYLKILVDQKDECLVGYYEPDAVLLSEDAVVIVGLLIGLNTIDCNLCLKEDDMDGPQGVIDFSLYLKPVSYVLDDSQIHNDDMMSILDQKNYVEELNEHLKSTVKNLQAQLGSLSQFNVSIKKELAIAQNDVINLHKQNRQLKEESLIEKDSMVYNQDVGLVTKNENPQEVGEYKEKIQDLEKELQLQICLKAEMEVAAKLLEKDNNEKQDTITSLRKQLDDIKTINLDMYKKLQDSQASVKHKTELIAKLESKTESMTEAIDTLESKYKYSEMGRMKAEQLNRELDLQTAQCEKQTSTVEGDLKVEREWRVSLQESNESNRQSISKLQNELSQMKIIAQKYATLQQEYYSLKEKSLEQEQTMEELGKQLSTSKLQISDLKEEVNKTKFEGTWADDSSVTRCKTCNKDFNLTRRKHHCRNCGLIFCKTCSDNSMSLPSSARPVRVCDDCFELLMGRNVVM